MAAGDTQCPRHGTGRKAMIQNGLFPSFVFWYLEAYWRGLSHFFAVRIQEIEKAMQSGSWEKELPLQVYSTWSKEYDKVHDQTFAYMFKRASLFPHAVIPIFIAALYFMW